MLTTMPVMAFKGEAAATEAPVKDRSKRSMRLNIRKHLILN